MNKLRTYTDRNIAPKLPLHMRHVAVCSVMGGHTEKKFVRYYPSEKKSLQDSKDFELSCIDSFHTIMNKEAQERMKLVV